MAEKLSKTYNPKEHEERLYKWWEEQGYFRPERQVELGLATPDGPRWCITLPPPNVTGALHLGHAMVAAVEDLMTRYNRMKGRQTLFLPGSDHAGIATQNVVERELRKEGLTRHDLGREKFVERVWEWKHVYHARITEQTKRLGMSCDWTRERFTLDEDLSRAVRTAFVRLYEKGLIYRGTYLVNWCPRCTSAISDLEVIPDERSSHLWHVRYPVVNDDWSGPPPSPPAGGGGVEGEAWGSGQWAAGATEFIQMATTRPETILGDTAVAVNPNDERWQRLVGRTAVLPALGRRIPIIADESVDPKFGTGAVKVTPAHDPTDNEIGIRQGLEAPNVMTDTAEMNALAGPYAGQDRLECRRNIVADLGKEGLLVKVEDYHHAVGTCERCHTDIEPRISTQWFVKTKPLAEAAMQVVRDGRTVIIPEREEKRFFPLDGEHPRLVHQPPVVVGPSHPGLVLRRLRQANEWNERSNRLRPLQQQKHPPGRGRARYLVLVGAVAVLDTGLAEYRRARLPPLLSHRRARDRLRDSVLLGGARDDAGDRADRPDPLRARLPARSGAHRGGRKGQQIYGGY